MREMGLLLMRYENCQWMKIIEWKYSSLDWAVADPIF